MHMLKKLLGNLPFNPSLIDDLPVYVRKLKRRERIGSISLLVLGLAILVEVFIAAFPAQPTLASSPNDLISGGFGSAAQAASDCLNNIDNFSDILSYFSISCSDLNGATTKAVSLSQFSQGFISVNRVAYAQGGESSVIIKGQTYWLRSVSSGSYYYSVPTKVLLGQNSSNNQFVIIYGSGDLLLPTQTIRSQNSCGVSLCSKLNLSVVDHSQNTSGTNISAKAGDQLIYVLTATSTAPKPIDNFSMSINVSNLLGYGQLIDTYGGKINNSNLTWANQTIMPGQTVVEQFTAQIYKPIPATPRSSTDPNYYNATINTVYGNDTKVQLPTSLIKSLELSNLKLNYLSPAKGLSMLIVLFLIVGYFQLRTNLFLRQLKDLRHNYNKGDL